MKFEVVISLDGSAFNGEAGDEVARLLQKVIDSGTLQAGDVLRLRDVNGNRVGFAAVSDS